MTFHVLLFCLGLAGLYFGAESLLRGAVGLARSLGVSALIVGLTVVACGTSTPELVVSITAAVRGQGNLALGNVVGSNIANIGLILALAAVIRPLAVELRLLGPELPVMIAGALALWYLGLDGTITRPEAAGLVTVFLGYSWLVMHLTSADPPAVRYQNATPNTLASLTPFTLAAIAPRRHVDFAFIMLGLAGLVAGATFVVESSVYFARRLGVDEATIGITIVAIGTSLPELATSVLAAARGQPGIAVGNVVGSNIFNVFAIVGVSALARPLGVPVSLLAFELAAMVAMSVLLVPVLWTGRRVSRVEGVALLTLYAGFVWVARGG